MLFFAWDRGNRFVRRDICIFIFAWVLPDADAVAVRHPAETGGCYHGSREIFFSFSFFRVGLRPSFRLCRDTLFFSLGCLLTAAVAVRHHVGAGVCYHGAHERFMFSFFRVCVCRLTLRMPNISKKNLHALSGRSFLLSKVFRVVSCFFVWVPPDACCCCFVTPLQELEAVITELENMQGRIDEVEEKNEPLEVAKRAANLAHRVSCRFVRNPI